MAGHGPTARRCALRPSTGPAGPCAVGARLPRLSLGTLSPGSSPWRPCSSFATDGLAAWGSDALVAARASVLQFDCYLRPSE
eukprot:15439606-Alexandrium_andersonii.AAC.1